MYKHLLTTEDKAHAISQDKISTVHFAKTVGYKMCICISKTNIVVAVKQSQLTC